MSEKTVILVHFSLFVLNQVPLSYYFVVPLTPSKPPTWVCRYCCLSERERGEREEREERERRERGEREERERREIGRASCRERVYDLV